MATLTIRKVDPDVQRRLRIRAAQNGRSMEAEHRDILTVTLRPGRGRTSFKEWLTRMPDVGTDRDFERIRRRARPVRL